MITKFIYGIPMNTGAVVKEISVSCAEIKYFTVEDSENITLKTKLLEDDVVYGLGETVRGINKRGWKYVSFCADDPVHTEGKESLYGAHNFIIVSNSKNKYGVFVDSPAKVIFDIGYTKLDELIITSECSDIAVYIIEAKTELEIVKELRTLTGKSYIAPLWSFGYQQSRWSYMNADAVKNVAKGYRDNNMPIDAIYLDIDYMEDYKD
ncbi:MAG: glycoside hydrolase family 31 protein, partial [Acutalibacteraceae bacterium]|nr:glycoside hydrolase family 31 protein [Acutalibacteraceae bacterium]